MRDSYGYKKLLLGDGSIVVVDKILMKDDFKEVINGNTELDKKISKLGECNE